MSTLEIAQKAKKASQKIQVWSNERKIVLLTSIAQALTAKKKDILQQNQLDLEEAERQLGTEGSKITRPLLKRLALDEAKFEAMVSGVLQVAALPDPIGKTTLATLLDDGLELRRVTAPIGVLLVIFEARPEVVVNIASLALKSSNAVILKGGKEATLTNNILSEVIREALRKEGEDGDLVQLVSQRDQINQLLDLDAQVDLVIPRGSKDLVKFIQSNTRIPVLGHADGLCSLFLDKHADLEKAVRITVDAKTNYPAACNAIETLLVHRDLLQTSLLRAVLDALLRKGVVLHLDPILFPAWLDKGDGVKEAKEVDWNTEFLDLELAVKVVSSLEEAIEWVNVHGSKHTDVIVTEDRASAEMWMNKVDAAGVYWNASSRFADGFRYGFGAEVGVSTNKTHARGPVGLEGLVIYKYKLYGTGQVVEDYSAAEGGGGKSYKHISL